MSDDAESRPELNLTTEPTPNHTPNPAPKNSKGAKQVKQPKQPKQAKQSRPPGRRGAALLGLRVAAGTVGIGVAVVAILAAGVLPIPRITSVAPGSLITPVPAAQQLLCPGSVLRLGDEFGQSATTPEAVGRPRVDSGTTGGDIVASSLAESDAGTGGTPSAPQLLSIEPAPAEDAATEDTAAEDPAQDSPARLLSGAQSESPTAPEISGLAAASCRGAASESWLVGGSTAVGRTTLVTLANPGEVASTVAVRIFSENGEVVASGASGIVVQPRGQRVVSLAGFAPSIESPVVRVTSQGGPIVASLQQATVRGLSAGGVDVVGASALPATTQVVPGVVVDKSLAVSGSLGVQGYEDLAPVIRLLVPGEKAATVTATLVPDSIDGSGASFSVELIGGRVTDVPLEEVADGIYTVTIESREPVVAGVRVSTVTQASNGGAGAGAAGSAPSSSDFAWFAAASPLESSSIATIADGPGTRLHLHNPGSEDATVVVTTLGGSEQPVLVPAEGSTTVPVTSRSTVVLSGFEYLYASVSLTGDARLAAYPVHPPAAESAPITVYVR